MNLEQKLTFADLHALFDGSRKDHPGRVSLDFSQPGIPYTKGYRYNDLGIPVKTKYGELQPCYGTIRYPRDEKGRKIRG